MQHNILRGILLPLTLLLLSFTRAFSQPEGSDMGNPIDAGSILLGSPYTDTKNNSPGNGFGNDMPQNPSDDIFYRFTLNHAGTVQIANCGSAIDTYLYVLDDGGNVIASLDDDGPACTGLQASLQLDLSAGTYYAVSEGYSYSSGSITTAISVLAYAQASEGTTMADAIDAGVLRYGYPYADTRNNSPEYGYGHDIGHPSDDIFYRFTVANADTVLISHCGSPIDTYLYLLDAQGNLLADCDDNGPACSELQASVKIFLQPGDYYVVSEGFSDNFGDISTQISCLTQPPTPAGANRGNAIDAGTLSPGQSYTNIRNNGLGYNYGNDYGQPSEDIYYKFTLEGEAEINIGHCGSGFDTYVHLLDSTGNSLASNDDNGPLCTGLQASLRKLLPAGTYYVVSEGFGYNGGNISTSIRVSGEEEYNRPDAFYQEISQVMQHVNLNLVNTGILLDAGVEFVNMANYSGSIALVDSNAVGSAIWRSVYGSLMSSKVNNQVSFTDFDEINTRVDTYTTTGQPRPFMLLHYDYQAFREDAVSAGLISVNDEQLYDVPGRTQSPYTTKTAFAIALAKDEVKAPGGYADFIFKSELVFGNSGKTLSLLKVDMGDGAGWRTATIGSAFTAHYAEGGVKELKYEATYADNSVFTGHSKIYIAYENERETPGGGSMRFYTPTIASHRISVNTPQGIRWATLQFRLTEHPEDGLVRSQMIKKPLIVAEGIDFWRITDPDDPSANQDIEKLLGSLNSRLHPLGNLRDSIDEHGYDIIYIDFDEATDYLENNSLLVQAAIDWVNLNKQALNGQKQQNVLMGLSMGGVLGRHALRSMELNNKAHDTKLLVTVDSPHQGANLPLSLQAFIQHLYDTEIQFMGIPIFRVRKQFPELEEGMKILTSPACTQLLKYRMTVNWNGDLKTDNGPHDRFYSNYHAMGMPSCRSIAISNGSGCSTGQGFNPHSTIFNMDKGISLLLKLLSLGAKAITGKGTLDSLGELNPNVGPASVYTDFEAKALPDHHYQRIYHGRIGVRIKVFGIRINLNLTNRSAYSSSYMLPFDNAPGGWQGFGGNDVKIPEDLQPYFTIRRFCYAPTVSALDVGNGATLSTAQLNQAYSFSAGNPTPFSSFVAAGRENESHVTFTQRNGQYLLKELRGNSSAPLSCSFACSPYFGIIGPDHFCGEGSYSLSHPLPAGATITWSQTGNAVFTSPTNTGYVSLENTQNELFTLRAVITSPCGPPITVQPKQIATGYISPPFGAADLEWNPSMQNGTGATRLFIRYPLPEAETYTWRCMDSYHDFTIETTEPEALINLGFNGFWAIEVTARTACGELALDGKTFDIWSYSYNDYNKIASTKKRKESIGLDSVELDKGQDVQIYPNPANTKLTVYVPKTDHSEGRECVITLFDLQGKMLKQIKSRQGIRLIDVDVKDIPDGTYLMDIALGSERTTQKIIVKH